MTKCKNCQSSFVKIIQKEQKNGILKIRYKCELCLIEWNFHMQYGIRPRKGPLERLGFPFAFDR